jgi:hypothetical protein
VAGWLAGWQTGWLARHFFVDSSTKMNATLLALTLNPQALGWLAGWLDLAGWLAGWLAGPAAWLAGGLAGWLAGWLAVWLAGWLACASFGIFFLTVSQKWMHH